MSRAASDLSHAMSHDLAEALTTHTPTDPAARDWRAAYAGAPEPCRWSREDVEAALAWAYGELRRMPGRVLPAAPGSTLGQMVGSTDAAPRDGLKPHEVSEAYAILGVGPESSRYGAGWVSKYLLTEAENFAVYLWCTSIADGVSLRSLIRSAGLVARTENDRKQRGLYRIAEGLCRDTIPLTPRALAARLTREKRTLSGSGEGWAAALAGGPPQDAGEPADGGSPPPPGGGSRLDADSAASAAPDLTTFLAAVDDAQAIEDAAARAQRVQDLIGEQLRRECADDQTRRRASSLTRLLVSRGLYDPAAARRAHGALAIPLIFGDATVLDTAEADGERHTYAITGPRDDVAAAVAHLLARFPPEAFETRFTTEPGGRRATGARRSRPIPQPERAEP